MFQNPLVATIAAFLEEIGLPVRIGEVPPEPFLPGIDIANGVLMIDQARLLYPGDLLHEAGHLALLPAAERALANGDMGQDGGMEMGAIAWSYAAAMHLGLPADVVFHDHGYRDGAVALRENFAAGRGVGVPILQWLQLSDKCYPAMRKWVRD